MTKISFDLCGGTYIFECIGHTGFAKHGADILCSAVSVLCYTLKSFLEDMESSGRLYGFVCDFRDGAVIMEFRPADESDRALFEALSAVLGGFRLLGESYPEYILADI